MLWGDALIWLVLIVGLAAVLYSAVGHGGASAYLAVMALFSVAPEVMRPTALALNLVVSALACLRFAAAGQINWRLLAVFALTATPAAFIGGGIHLDPDVYRPLVGLVLWFAAAWLFWKPRRLSHRPVRAPALLVAVPVGAGLGLLAGLTGTGGGIFLSPLMILFAWEEPRRTSGVAAGFIFLNSAAGLLGAWSSIGRLPAELPVLVAAVAVGAVVGTWLGLRRLPRERLLQVLGVVLLVAGAKLIFQ